MFYMVLLVLDDIEKVDDVCDAWEQAGVGGITILESTGLARIRYKQAYRDDIPLMPSLRSLLQGAAEHHRTLFSIVEDEPVVDKLVAATEAALGDLHRPQTGILVAWPLSHVAGYNRRPQA